MVKKQKKENDKKKKVSFLMTQFVPEATFDAPEGESSKKNKKAKKASKKDNIPSNKTNEVDPKVTKYFGINELAVSEQEEDVDDEIVIEEEPNEKDQEKATKSKNDDEIE